MQMTLRRFQSEQSDLGQLRQPYFFGGRPSGIYRRHTNRARLAAQAAHKWDETGTSIRSPMETVRAVGQNILSKSNIVLK
jgi:hypothetical protein